MEMSVSASLSNLADVGRTAREKDLKQTLQKLTGEQQQQTPVRKTPSSTEVSLSEESIKRAQEAAVAAAQRLNEVNQQNTEALKAENSADKPAGLAQASAANDSGNAASAVSKPQSVNSAEVKPADKQENLRKDGIDPFSGQPVKPSIKIQDSFSEQAQVKVKNSGQEANAANNAAHYAEQQQLLSRNNEKRRESLGIKTTA